MRYRWIALAPVLLFSSAEVLKPCRRIPKNVRKFYVCFESVFIANKTCAKVKIYILSCAYGQCFFVSPILLSINASA